MTALYVTLAVVGVAGALYGLHRLALHLESKGLLYYREKKSCSSALGSFVALQQMIEPSSRHVITVDDQMDAADEDGDPDHPQERTDNE